MGQFSATMLGLMIFASAVSASNLRHGSVDGEIVEPGEFSGVCNLLHLCGELSVDERRWLADQWPFVAVSDRASCAATSHNTSELIWCLKAKLSARLPSNEILNTKFPRIGSVEKVVGCWKAHVAGSFYQDWCFDENRRFRVTENSGGDVAAWEGNWFPTDANRKLSIRNDGAAAGFVCDVRFTEDFAKFVEVNCLTTLNETDYYRGIWTKVKGD
jgi:hypothetical protein